MWEHRLIWTADAPSWWDEVWTAGAAALHRRERAAEDRPDTYLVLPDRPDVGLKLRGLDGELEIKVRHAARDGWELWEKVPFFEWNDFEAARFSVLLERELPAAPIDTRATPVDGVKTLLGAAGIPWREARLDKVRLQARAGDLVPALASDGIDPHWLAELVVFDGAGPTARSICFETMAPEASLADSIPDAGRAICAGYPEFLIGAKQT